MNGLGVRQRRMLVSMQVNGGHLPATWRLNWHDLDVLRSLWRRGLTTDSSRFAMLTADGQIAADLYRGDRL